MVQTPGPVPPLGLKRMGAGSLGEQGEAVTVAVGEGLKPWSLEEHSLC